MQVFFSVSGRHFRTDAVDYYYMPDMAMNTARNVSIGLGFQLARYIKLQFIFVTEWLLLSEVYFHSGKQTAQHPFKELFWEHIHR